MELQHIVLTFLVLIRSAPSVNFSAFHMVDAEWKKNVEGERERVRETKTVPAWNHFRQWYGVQKRMVACK